MYRGIKLTKHVLQKISILRKYGFETSLNTIAITVTLISERLYRRS